MSAFRVYFYRGPTGLRGRLLRLWTGSPYSHCALVIVDETGTDVIAEVTALSGVRSHLVIPEIDLRESRWDHIDIPVSKESRAALLAWARSEVGAGFDHFWALWSQFLHLPWEHGTRWSPAEFCAAALQRLGMLQTRKACAFSPGSLYRALRPGRS